MEIYIFLAAIIILQIVIIAICVKSKKSKDSDKFNDKLIELKSQNESLAQALGSEFERNRRESLAFQNRVSDEISNNSKAVTESLGKMTESNSIL